MVTIAYDKPVKDLIRQLSATGHVTHTEYKKTSVTLHHNAGRLSHEGVLNVWKTRPASAHLDVDGPGRVAQYVKVNEYAWAAGNTTGNIRSIHIEMANSALGPSWTVGDATWKSAARLSGWLFAKVIGVRPSSSNFFQHEHWSATACAGPYTDKVWPKIMVEAQKAYDYFKGSHTTTGKIVLVVDGTFGPQTIARLKQWLGLPTNDTTTLRTMWRALQKKVGGYTDAGLPNATMWRGLQRLVGAGVDGVPGPDTYRHLQAYLNNH